MKKALRFLLPAAAVLLVVLAILWQNGAFTQKTVGDNPAGTVHLTIRCDRALAYEGLQETIRSVLPEDGVLADDDAEIYEGDTVFTVLSRFCKEKRLPLSSKGSTRYGVYVDGIAGLFEMDAGAQSGWMFSVNGDFPSKSAGDTALKDGDDVAWVYTLDLGKDVGSRAS